MAKLSEIRIGAAVGTAGRELDAERVVKLVLLVGDGAGDLVDAYVTQVDAARLLADPDAARFVAAVVLPSKLPGNP